MEPRLFAICFPAMPPPGTTTRPQIERDLASGHPHARLLYITPESLFTRGFTRSLGLVAKNNELRRLVVDEAHCISVGSVCLADLRNNADQVGAGVGLFVPAGKSVQSRGRGS